MTAYAAGTTKDKPPDVITISRFGNKRDKHPKPEHHSWGGLTRLLSRHVVRREKDGPLWSPTAYVDGTTRGARTVEAVTELVYEFDGVAPDWSLLDAVAFVAHTTHSHLVVCEHNPTGGPSWRVVLRLAQPVPLADWQRVWRRGRARYAPASDPSCSDPCRMYYLPTCPPGQRGAAQIGEGIPIDPDTLPETPEEVQERELAAAVPVPTPAGVSPIDGERPGDRFTRETTWAQLLEPRGWRCAGERGEREVWNRPGRTDDREAHSANLTPDGNLYVWTSNAPPFEPQRSYTKLGAYVTLEHGGDWTAGIRALAKCYDPPLAVDLTGISERTNGKTHGVGGNSEKSREHSEIDDGASPQSGRRNSEHSEHSEQGIAAETAEWGPLEALTAEALPTFPLDALPGWMRAYVSNLADATQTPPDLAALIGLGVLSTAAGGRVKVWVRSTWQEPVNLYIAAALESGNRKSGVVRQVTNPLREWERLRAKERQPDVAAARSRRRVAEQALEHAEARAAKESDLSQRVVLQDEAEQLARQLEALPVVQLPRVLTEDCTPERLAGLLAEQGGRMAILSPEGDVFDVMAGRYSSEPNFGIFLKGHAGDPHHVDRQGRPAEYVAEPALTIAVSPQPDVLGGLADKPSFRGRGLLARFLYALPPSLLGRRAVNPPEMPDEAQASYDKAVLAILERFQTSALVDGEEPHHYIKPHAEALQALDRFLAWVEPQLGPHGDLAAVKDWGGKLTGAVVRIAALLHLADKPADAVAWKSPISRETMERAIHIGRYLIPHAQAAYDLMGLDTDTGSARTLVDWICAKRKERFTKREAHQANKGHFKTVAELEPALQLLEERGYIRREAWERPKGQRGQNPSPAYLVNPALLSPSVESSTQNAQDAQKSPVPDSGGASAGPSQNTHGISQNWAAPAWPGAAHPSEAAEVNGHARALPDESDGYAKVPAAAGVAVAEPEEEGAEWTA